MSKTPLNFMLDTSRSHVHGEARAKILSLFQEIDNVYKTHMRRSTGKTCNICGKGDTNEQYRVRDVVFGYEHRESDSPTLCYGHWCGWRTSYANLDNGRKAKLLNVNRKVGDPLARLSSIIAIKTTVFEEPVLSDEEIDLHFAQFLAKQLTKGLKNAYNK